MTNVNDPEYDPNPYPHAMRHLDAAEEWIHQYGEHPELLEVVAEIHALLGIGWALLAIARKP